jgi:hypothetical protein
MNYFCILIRIVLHDTIFYDTVIIMGRERPGYDEISQKWGSRTRDVASI